MTHVSINGNDYRHGGAVPPSFFSTVRPGLDETIARFRSGLCQEAVERFLNGWIIHIEDVTPLARLPLAAKEQHVAPQILPDKSEVPYPLDAGLAAQIGATTE
jgi:hypothetical protein